MSKVNVVSDENGNIIHVSPNNPEYGWIFVEQKVVQMERGWLKIINRKARLMGKMNDLELADYKKGATLPGKVVVKESFIPFDLVNPDRNLKLAGKNGVVCRVDDQPIYRQLYYTDNLADFDEFIQHTNVDEIKELQAAQRELNYIETIEEATL